MQQGTSTESDKHLSKVIKIDESQIQNHLDKMVRSTVEETLNGQLRSRKNITVRRHNEHIL